MAILIFRFLKMEQSMPPNKKMSPTQRRKALLQLVIENGTIKINDAAQKLDVSPVTVYRDVQTLEEMRTLLRTNGELRAYPTSTSEMPPELRSAQAIPEKQAICAAAAKLINPGDAILLDDSSTALPIVDMLQEVSPLAVISNSLTVFEKIKGRDGIQPVLIGGRYVEWANAFYGSLATTLLRELQADICFTSDAAVSLSATYNPIDYVVDFKRAMFAASKKKVLLADHQKFSRSAFQVTASLSEFDYIVVDRQVPKDILAGMRESGCDILLAE